MSTHLKTSVLVGMLLVPLATSLAAPEQEHDAPVPAAAENTPTARSAAEDTAETRAQEMVARWRSRLTELEGAARAADQDTLRVNVHELLQEMMRHVATGHEELLARALRLDTLFHTLTERASNAPRSLRAGLNTLASIRFARQLWPPVVRDLGSFGTLGSDLQEMLQEADREVEKLRERAAKARAKKDFAPPNRQGYRALRYPPAAKVAGIEAAVQVRYLVDEDGAPYILEVVGRDAQSSLLLAAFEAVSEMRFEPAMAGGRAVAAEDVITLGFKVPR